MPDFRGVMEKDIESIIRRSLVIKFRARFFPKIYLDKCLPGHETYGIFAGDEGVADNRDIFADLSEIPQELASRFSFMCGILVTVSRCDAMACGRIQSIVVEVKYCDISKEISRTSLREAFSGPIPRMHL